MSELEAIFSRKNIDASKLHSYRNEEKVGKGLVTTELKREDVFITTGRF